jgi:hypothetical protein
MHSTYILIDTALLGELRNKVWLKKKRRPSWITSIYMRYAVDVSPVVIDIERAIQCSRIAAMMGLVNAQLPQLGVSFIETDLTFEEVVAHLRKFIYVCTESGVELTLRFADSAVLPVLASVLSPEQWALITAPFRSWKIHGRDGKLMTLPIVDQTTSVELPLVLSGAQVIALKDSMGTDQLLVNLRMQRPDFASKYCTFEAYTHAAQTRHMWHAAGHSDDPDLINFASKVFDTEGRLLRLPGLAEILTQTDRSKIRQAIQQMVVHQC